MSTVATLEREIVVDENGKPLEVIIPYDQFLEMTDKIECHLLDFDEQEISELREAISDADADDQDAFVAETEV